MNITDIVNRDIVSLTNCESEPIHIPGSIQPHGFLLGITDNQVIDFCSANSADFILLAPEMILGKSLSDIFPNSQTEDFASNYIKKKIDLAKPYVFTLNDISYNTTVHRDRDTLVLELEPFPDGTMELPNLYTQTKNFVSMMERHSYLPELCQEIAAETKMITGYDRVMIYQFDEEYNGEVIAESRREDLESFERQKYPHTDIPAQARELYIRNPLRMIADISYQPVPLLTLNTDGKKDNQSLDLSLSILRSVSPIHVEYLKNMGVKATLTISLLKDGKLWGLIACHHYAPKVLPHYTRLSALLQGHFLTSQIAVREVAEEFEVGQTVDQAVRKSLDLLQENENFIEENYNSPDLLQIANATGFVIYYSGKIYKNGKVPDDKDLVPLLKFLSEKYPNSDLHTDQLVDVYPDGEKLSQFAAGIIYHSIATDTPDAILWLRMERIETIKWAGNPQKAVVINNDGGMRLTPRKSFELWMEEVKNKSTKWRKSELNASSSFAYALQKHVNLRYVKTQENKNRILNDELKVANKELANLNWISTHDLKEPLRKIQIFASKVLDRENPDLSLQVKDSVERMRFAAEKMQVLIEDILAYSQAGSTVKVYEETDLNVILARVLEELGHEIDEKNALITTDKLPTLSVIPFQIQQLFVNLISNALKFSKAGIPTTLSIETEVIRNEDLQNKKYKDDVKFDAIYFRDNGIGFEEEYETRIFDIFQRLHAANKYPGSGIGLAICKKIMENHKGWIIAESVLGEGSCFKIYFPQIEN